MNKIIVIGLVGTSGTGKSTIEDLLYSIYEQESSTIIRSFPFAEPIKIISAALSNDLPQAYNCQALKSMPTADYLNKISRRELMQKVTDFGFSISPSLWYDLWKLKVTSFINDFKFFSPTSPRQLVVIVPDVRYIDSFDYIKGLSILPDVSSVLWKVEREGCQGVNKHSSEMALFEHSIDQMVDETIHNNDSVEELEVLIRELCLKYLV